MKERFFKMARLAVAVVVGNALYAAAVAFFVAPSGLVLGGFTGLSIAISYFADIQVSYTVLGFHTAALAAGALVLGKGFAASTAASTFLYPMLLNFFERIAAGGRLPLVQGLPLNALFSALLIGLSLGILMRSGTSTGGTEVIPLILHKCTGRPVGRLLLLIDGAVMLLGLVYSDLLRVGFGILIVMAYSAIVQWMGRKPGKKVPSHLDAA